MSERSTVGFFDTVMDRAIGRLRAAWRDIAGQGRGTSAAARPELTADDTEHLREQLRACLDGTGGEVAARTRAAELGRTYLGFNAEGRKQFLHLLAEEFD